LAYNYSRPDIANHEVRASEAITMKYDYVKTRRADVKPISKSKSVGFKRQMGLYSKLNVWVYRMTFGYLMNTAMGGYPICIVTLIGRRTGRKRRIPLIHVPDGEDEILVGSQAGLDQDPFWTHSIRENPEVTITFAGRRRRFVAVQIDDDEKRQIWPLLCSIYPAYDEYQARTDRNIPVFRCRPVD
jgi:deazaflavin-dependent oxidoreductase (nitroreductase family)